MAAVSEARWPAPAAGAPSDRSAEGPAGRHVVVLTYTLTNPTAMGVFFRALRLGFELADRGHRVTVLNAGPLPADPKIERARRRLAFVELPWQGPDFGLREARDLLFSLAPDLMVIGEGPFDTMTMHYRAARGLWAPFVLLDQYYKDWLLTRRPDVDRILLYSLRPFVGPNEFRRFGDRYRLVPPFIAEVTPAERLPAPAALAGEPWVTILGFEPIVLERGLELVAALPAPRPVAVALAHDPAAALALAAAKGLDPARVIAPGLRPDPELFGFMAASRAVVLANGFMQILESLALARPAVCISRGIGLPAWQVDDRYKVYVSIGEEPEVQVRRLAEWVRQRPFPADLAASLAAERGGAARLADELEALLAVAGRPENVWRRMRRVARSYLSAAE